MRIKPWAPAALFLAGLVCACASDPGPQRGRGPGVHSGRGARPEGAGRRGPAAPGAAMRVFISPAGEPFRPRPGSPEPLRQWFDGADANHDGAIDAAEFLADHMRFFSRLDANADGFIDSAEVTTYEEKIAPEILGASDRPGSVVTPGVPEPTPGAPPTPLVPDGLGYLPPRNNTSEPRGPEYDGAGRFGLINEPEPIRAADANYDFRVSKAEWQAASARRFALLDANHDGRITFDELHLLQSDGRKSRAQSGGGRRGRGGGGGRQGPGR